MRTSAVRPDGTFSHLKSDLSACTPTHVSSILEDVWVYGYLYTVVALCFGPSLSNVSSVKPRFSECVNCDSSPEEPDKSGFYCITVEPFSVATQPVATEYVSSREPLTQNGSKTLRQAMMPLNYIIRPTA